jgi:dolichyl-diphosphooligosaccharide--protein glycosyltransferase
MAIVPAHMMRSVGGGYDNESIAITAMTMTFYCWCRALRGSVHFQGWSTIVWGILTAISYFYVRCVVISWCCCCLFLFFLSVCVYVIYSPM